MRAPHRHPRAFSLVEVVLAMGIVSFALVTTMGLTLVGLKGFQQAISTTTETEIAQQLVNQLQQTSYATIVANGSTNYYFTQEGLPTNAANSIYTAAMNTPSSVALPNAGTPVTSANLVMTTFNITSKSAPLSTNVIQVYISNTGS